ncbi:hypothetical protein HSR121_2547 [Halapricum desulfuricans]|uniref:Uncharacterized protein n=1 Tax=Halapricum desulfuricans TaxID=2841257 RepID=A0A897N3S5_9EURY|nr:hypothetical protein HSR121_2547 [Halapricum desulfuricans]
MTELRPRPGELDRYRPAGRLPDGARLRRSFRQAERTTAESSTGVRTRDQIRLIEPPVEETSG